MKYIWLIIIIPFWMYSQQENRVKENSLIKSNFYVNASTSYTPYQNHGFYNQKFIKSIGWSLEGGIYIVLADELYIQVGLNQSRFKSYNFRIDGNVYHQLVSFGNVLSLPLIGGFALYQKSLFAGVGIQKRLKVDEFYKYKIYENDQLIYSDKSKFLKNSFISRKASLSFLFRGELKVKNNFYIKLDYQFLPVEAFYLGLTYNIPW